MPTEIRKENRARYGAGQCSWQKKTIARICRQVSKVRQSSRRFQLPNVSRQVPAAELLHGW